MNDTPRTDGMTGYFIDGSGIKKGDAIYIDPKGPFVLADFARELERENTHLLVLATNAEFDRSKLERELIRMEANCDHLQVIVDNNGYPSGVDYAKIERELAELKAENARLREAGKALRDALAFECKKLGDCPREIDEWDAVAKASYSL